MTLKKMAAILAAAMLLFVSAASAETAVETIMTAGTTQAFTDEAVSSEDLNTILQAGLAAASALNQQPWYFVAVTNKEFMSELSGGGFGGGFGGGSGFTPPAGADGKPEGAPEGKPGETSGTAPEGAPAGGSFPSGSFPAAPAGSGSAKAALGDTPVAIIIYANPSSSFSNSDFDCGLAAQNMYIAAASLGYGVKLVSSPTMTLNGERHDELCEKMGVDPSMKAVAVLLIGRADDSVDAASSATVRETVENKVTIIE